MDAEENKEKVETLPQSGTQPTEAHLKEVRRDSVDRFARWMAICGLIISVLAIVLPYYQQRRALQLQQEQFAFTQAEQLAVELNPFVNGLLRLTDNNFGPAGGVVQVPIEVVFSNTGNQKFSITKLNLSTGPRPGSLYYSGMNGGLTNRDGAPVETPITLEPGESKRLILYVGVLVHRAVLDVIASLKEKPPSTRSAMRSLARKGLDLYGHRVTLLNDEPLAIQFDEAEKAPRIWVEAETGRGNLFRASTSQYAIPIH